MKGQVGDPGGFLASEPRMCLRGQVKGPNVHLQR
jgi:hypothetical protein